MRIERITDWQAFAQIEPHWQTLVAQSGAPIFLSWPWIDLWRRHLATASPWIVTVWQDDALVGLAPWGLQRTDRLRRLGFLGDGPLWPDHLDLLVIPRYRLQVGEAVARHLLCYRDDWDMLSLRSLALDSSLPNALKPIGACHARPPIACPYIPLTDIPDWETFQRRRLSSRMRKKGLRYFQNLLERHHPGQVEYRRIEDPDQLPEAMTVFFDLHLHRWQERRVVTPFADERFRRFHRDMAAVALRHQWLGLYQLRVGSDIIASQYGFHFQNVFYDYQHAFHPDWEQYSPGRLLTAHIVADCIRLGRWEYDFLSGTEPYKFSWTRQVRYNPYLLYAHGLKGSAHLTVVRAWDGLRALKQQLRSKK